MNNPSPAPELAGIEEKYHSAFIQGSNWCADGQTMRGNPFPPFSNRARHFRSGFRWQDKMIETTGTIG